LWLVVTLGAVAGAFLLLGAELLAWVQVLVYVGAVVVLIVFALMLTRRPTGETSAEVTANQRPAAVIAVVASLGLAAAFMTGLETAVALGADIIVNTDADNQYDARDIENLVRPIVEGRAEMVIGARPIGDTEHFSWIKKKLQGLGSSVVRLASNTPVADAPSGFRAFTRDVAQRLNVFSSYTYTLETIIQAGHSNIRVLSVPIRTNPDLRPSRLVKSVGRYVWRSASTIVRIFATYRPLTFFWLVAAFFLLVGSLFGGWYFFHMLTGQGAGHVQSALLAAASVTIGIIMFMLGFIADLQSVNRRLLEGIDWRLRQLERPSQATRSDAVARTRQDRVA
jgi:hypothetical protein